MIKIEKFKKEESLKQEFNFKDIYEAIEFMKKSCDVFTELDHHPDLFSLEGKMITIEITTHDMGGITDKDYEVLDGLKLLVKDCCKPFNPQMFNI